MKKDYTHISVVLDRSGSMAACAQDAIGGFNQFIEEQKAIPGQATLTLVQFDTEYEIVHDAIDIQTVPALSLTPRGNTALLDALGKAIVATGEWLSKKADAERPATVVFVVMTDGHENSSNKYTNGQIKEMVQHQTDVYKWQFVFLGANMDAIDEGAKLGVGRASTMTYDQSMPSAAYQVVSKNLASLRQGKRSSLDFSDEDRKKAGNK